MPLLRSLSDGQKIAQVCSASRDHVCRCDIFQFNRGIKLAAHGLVARCKTQRPNFPGTGRVDGVTLIRRYVNEISRYYPPGFVLNLDHTGTLEDKVPLVGIVKMRFGLAPRINLKVVDELKVGS